MIYIVNKQRYRKGKESSSDDWKKSKGAILAHYFDFIKHCVTIT